MKTSAEKLEEMVKAFMDSMIWMQPEAADLVKLYWAEVNSDSTYTALSVSAAATFTTKMTKQEVINGLTWLEDVEDFYTNSAVTTTDYLQNLQGIIYGNDQYASPGISPAVEAFADRLLVMAQSSLQLFKDAKDLLDVYFDSEISAATGAVTGEEMPFYTFSKSDFTEAITLIEQFKKMINNEAVTTGDYGATVAKWRKIL